MITIDQESALCIRKHIPEYMYEGLMGYVEAGQEPGKFLRAVLENKLVEAYAAADTNNAAAMQGWATVLYNYVPAALWGDEQRVDAHIEAVRREREQSN
jgi:hypothetical protein